MSEKMIRRIAREVALQSLFQIDFNSCEAEAAVAAAMSEHEEENAPKALNYAMTLVQGVLAIDARLSEYAIDWTVERMPATDRNILRVAVYEMLFAEETVSAGIAINEAVEVAKAYGTEEAPRFVNGVLGKLAKA